MELEIKTYITIPPEKEELDVDNLYPGYMEMTQIEDMDVFNYEFGRSGGYPSGRVVFFVDGQPIPIASYVSELYRYWNDLLRTISLRDKSIETQKYLSSYFADGGGDGGAFTIQLFYHKKTVTFYRVLQDFHYTKQVLGEFSLDAYRRAVLQGFLDFMWHTNLEFEAITHDSLGDEIEYDELREDKSELYACRYIFLQYMKELYKQKTYDLDALIHLDVDTDYYTSKLKYDLGD